MGHALFVFGAAGSGKTTFCRNIREYSAPKRSIKLVNLDPAQENGADFDVDLCDHITVGEVMDEMDFGPNGALFYALHEMSENLDELCLEDLENEFFIFDCPGQIELFLHSEILQKCVEKVKSFSKVAIVYVIDSSNFLDPQKLLYTLLCATISTYRFCLPVLTVVSKADLLDEETLERIVGGDPEAWLEASAYNQERDLFVNQERDKDSSNLEKDLPSASQSKDLYDPKKESPQNHPSVIIGTDPSATGNPAIKQTNAPMNTRIMKAMAEYINNNGMMDFLPINWKEEHTIDTLLLCLDNILQRFDDEEVKESRAGEQ